jgi:hypothetical protein
MCGAALNMVMFVGKRELQQAATALPYTVYLATAGGIANVSDPVRRKPASFGRSFGEYLHADLSAPVTPA